MLSSSFWPNVLSVNCHLGVLFVRPNVCLLNVCSFNCPSVNCPMANCPSAICPVTESTKDGTNLYVFLKPKYMLQNTVAFVD